jgi:hypothetical protein
MLDRMDLLAGRIDVEQYVGLLGHAAQAFRRRRLRALLRSRERRSGTMLETKCLQVPLRGQAVAAYSGPYPPLRSKSSIASSRNRT